jgi:hypothetical protein
MPSSAHLPHPLAPPPSSRAAEVGATAVISCGPAPGLPFNSDLAVTGSFSAEDQGSYLVVPFGVPRGMEAIRVRYCYDQPGLSDPQGLNEHTLDLGLYQPESTKDRDTMWGRREFRGWGGSSRPDTTVSGEAVAPQSSVAGTTNTTVGYLPGAIPAGLWAAELGVAAVADEGPMEDGSVMWRLEIDWINDPSYADEPYRRTPYDPGAARNRPGWYAGDMHVHARHSNPTDSDMRTAFDYAFCPDPKLGARCEREGSKPGADLDFITLSDYVTTRHWHEIGRFQRRYPGHLIIRSAEVITYRGHVNNHAAGAWTDYRTGRIDLALLEGAGEKAVTGARRLRGPVAPGSRGGVFDQIHAAGGWTQINHPTIFPSFVPVFQPLCRGCPWDYSSGETNYAKVDAIEVATGPAGLQDVEGEPGPNPFTVTAIEFYEAAIDDGGRNSNHIAAVGSSDSHKAGQSSLTTSPIGQATTVVFARRLSQKAIQRGVEAGHTYVKIWGNDGPDLRFSATSPGGGSAIMGDTIRGPEVAFRARVLNLREARSARPGTYTLHVIRDGRPHLVFPIPQDREVFTTTFPAAGPGRYRLQVERGASGAASIENVSTPIWVSRASRRRPACARRITGTRRGDSLRGTRGGDRIRGAAGDDAIHGLAGRDCLHGDRGADRLRGGRGADRLFGGSGRDYVHAVGQARDLVRCGRGRDRAVVGFADRVRACERVRRQKAS